jgi:predicted N-acyltransferase
MADRDGEIVARIGKGVASFGAAEWDACAGAGNPFLSHAFLSALENREAPRPAPAGSRCRSRSTDPEARPRP